MSLVSWILTLAICLGQLIKIPSGNQGGLTLLDVTVITLSLIGIYRPHLKFNQLPTFIKAGFVFIMVAIVSLLFTPLNLSTTQLLISVSYIIRFSFYFLLAFFIYSNVFPSLKKNLQEILLYSGLGLSVLGILQFIFIPDLGFLQSQGWDPHVLRTFSTFLDPNFLGAYLTLTLIFIFSKMSFPLKINKELLIPLIIYVALMTTFSRSSYLNFLISGLILGFLKKSWSIKILVVILFAILLVGFQIYTVLVSKPRNIDRTSSADARLGTWQQGINIFQNNPLLGAGFNTYRYALVEEGLAKESFASERGGSSNDSSLLNVLATTGIIGFCSYIFLLFSLFKVGFNHLKMGGAILVSILSGLLVHSTFNNTLFYPHIMFWIFTLPVFTLINPDKDH